MVPTSIESMIDFDRFQKMLQPHLEDAQIMLSFQLRNVDAHKDTLPHLTELDEDLATELEQNIYLKMLESDQNIVLQCLQVLQSSPVLQAESLREEPSQNDAKGEKNAQNTFCSGKTISGEKNAKGAAKQFLETLYNISANRLQRAGWEMMTAQEKQYHLTKVDPDMVLGAGCQLFKDESGTVKDILDIELPNDTTWHPVLMQSLNMLLSPGEDSDGKKIWPVKVVDLDVEQGIAVLDILETDAEAACDDVENGGCAHGMTIVRKLIFGKFWTGINAEESESNAVLQTSIDMHSLPGGCFNDSWSSASLVGLGCFAIRSCIRQQDVPRPVRVLFVGLGGGLIPSAIGRYFYGKSVELYATEKSEKVIDMAQRWFGLTTKASIEDGLTTKSRYTNDDQYQGPGSMSPVDFSATGQSLSNKRKERKKKEKNSKTDLKELRNVIPVHVVCGDISEREFGSHGLQREFGFPRFDVIIADLGCSPAVSCSPTASFYETLLHRHLSPQNGVFLVKEAGSLKHISKRVETFKGLSDIKNVHAFAEFNLRSRYQDSPENSEGDSDFIYLGHTDVDFPEVNPKSWDGLFLDESVETPIQSLSPAVTFTPSREAVTSSVSNVAEMPSTIVDTPPKIADTPPNAGTPPNALPRCMPLSEAQKTRAVKIPHFFTKDEIEQVKALGVEAARDLNTGSEIRSDDKLKAWKVLFLNESNVFAQSLPELGKKIFQLIEKVDKEEGWNLGLSEAQCSVRVVEYHRQVAPSPGLSDIRHYDMDSLVTFDVLLNDDFEGGEFQTLECDGSLTNHTREFPAAEAENGTATEPLQGRGNKTIKSGDALLFVSHKYHCVSPVIGGERHVLVIEFWRYPFRGCGHRCELLSHTKICAKDSYSRTQELQRQMLESKNRVDQKSAEPNAVRKNSDYAVKKNGVKDIKKPAPKHFPMILGDRVQEGDITRLFWQAYAPKTVQIKDLSEMKFVEKNDDCWDCFE